MVAVCEQSSPHFPNVAATHHCIDCKVDLCYVCAQNHTIGLAHATTSSLTERIKNKGYSDAQLSRKFHMLRSGALAEAELSKFVCNCGVA